MNRARCLTMSASMILAYQEGRKRQTRRVVVPEPIQARDGRWDYKVKDKWRGAISANGKEFSLTCPYGEPGDELLLREGYEVTEYIPGDPRRRVHGRYLADGAVFSVPLAEDEWLKFCARQYPLRAQPGRFMYRSLCRHRVGIREVRVERLQDISDGDVQAEGVSLDSCHYAELLAPVAGKVVTGKQHWINGDDTGEDYCERCIDKAVREAGKDIRLAGVELAPDGGWALEEDAPRWCAACGRILEVNCTDEHIRTELTGFEAAGIDSAEAAYIAANCLDSTNMWDEVYPDLAPRWRRVLWRYLWDSINAKRGWGWDENPWVWVLEFEPMEEE